jgi:hypothetical protein
VIDQVRGRLGHASRGTRGADAPTFARERDQEVMATAGAARTGEPMRQNATGEIPA